MLVNNLKVLFLFLVCAQISFAQDLLITKKGDSINCSIRKFKNGFLIYSNAGSSQKLKEIAIEKLKSFKHKPIPPLLDSMVFVNGGWMYCSYIHFENDKMHYNYLTADKKENPDSSYIGDVALIKFGMEYNKNFAFKNNVSINHNSYATASTIKIDKLSLGIGTGLDHGGFGGNVSLYPIRNIGLFAGVGTNLAGMGFNGGLKLRFIPENAESNSGLFLTGMYGYNTVVISSYGGYVYYGASAGIGYDARFNKHKNGYWTFALIFPFRSPESYTHTAGAIMLPFTISIGYKFILK